MMTGKTYRVTFNGFHVVKQAAPDRGHAALRAYQNDHNHFACYALETGSTTFEIHADDDDRLLAIASVSLSRSDNTPVPYREKRTPYHGKETR